MLKEVIKFHKQWNTTVFDRIDHWVLFKNLLNKKYTPFIVKILMVWYCEQEMFVIWGNIRSNFTIPINVYMNELSIN